MAGIPPLLYRGPLPTVHVTRAEVDVAREERVDDLERLIWSRHQATCNRAASNWLVKAGDLAAANGSFEQILAAVRKADAWIQRAKTSADELDRLAGVKS